MHLLWVLNSNNHVINACILTCCMSQPNVNVRQPPYSHFILWMSEEHGTHARICGLQPRWQGARMIKNLPSLLHFFLGHGEENHILFLILNSRFANVGVWYISSFGGSFSLMATSGKCTTWQVTMAFCLICMQTTSRRNQSLVSFLLKYAYIFSKDSGLKRKGQLDW